MAVHMVRGCLSADSGMSDSDVQTEVDDWVSKRTKWGGGSGNDASVDRVTANYDSGIEYLLFNVRFEWDSASKDNTLQKCMDKFKNKVDWVRLGYHVCDHDENDRSGCSWDEQREWTAKNVSIPSEVPSFV